MSRNLIRCKILLPRQSYRWTWRKHYHDGEKQRECRKKHKKNSLIYQFYSVRHNLSVIDDVIYMNDLCVPAYALREDVVKKVHEMGHFGETKGLNPLQQNYWWPGCSSVIRRKLSDNVTNTRLWQNSTILSQWSQKCYQRVLSKKSLSTLKVHFMM